MVRGTFLRGAVVTALVTVAAMAGAETLRFTYTAGDAYKIKGTVIEDVYLNGRFDHRAEILDKIAAEVREVRGDAGLLSATFQTSERRSDSNAPYMLNEEYESEFWRDGRGTYDIDSSLFMPVVRDVPLFPAGDVKPGDTWVGDGSEAHDFRLSGLPDPLTFPIAVAYRYLRNEEKDGRKVAVLGIAYTVFHRFQGIRAMADFDPVLITGYSNQTYYFDVDLGQPLSYTEEFDFIFDLASGDVVEYRGTATGELTDSPSLDRLRMAEEIRKALEREKVTNTTVEVVDEGVTITVENIQFTADSAALLQSEKDKLRKIADIIRPIERDILVVGHTARYGTEESCQVLSEKRARTVGDYLLELGAKDPTEMVFKGMGSQEPIADNVTEAGMSRNRRVEITILEN